MKSFFNNFWSIFIQDSKYGRRSLVFSTLWLVIHNFINGAVNGLFQSNIKYLKYIIIGMDAMSVTVLLYFWTTAKCYIANALLFMYLCLKFAFNFIIYFQHGLK